MWLGITLIGRSWCPAASVLLWYTYIDTDVVPLRSLWHFISNDIIGDYTIMTVQTIDIKVASNGRMILPLSVRKAMGLQGEAKIILTIENDQVRLSPIGHGISRAKALYREHARQYRTTDDFLNDRANEASADDRAGEGA